MPPDEPSSEEQIEQLPEDNDTPFSPADPPRDPDAEADDDRQLEETRVDDTHPVTDTDIDQDEMYDAGLAEASGEIEPNAGSDVVGYTPPDDQP
ncbi:MAG TPA: hypothetical protein VHB51_01845 [Candidatus Saccharimonadales bacterium]|nr:hypothetical protein [Candidatus Saccharimonadales bacterium]